VACLAFDVRLGSEADIWAAIRVNMNRRDNVFSGAGVSNFFYTIYLS